MKQYATQAFRAAINMKEHLKQASRIYLTDCFRNLYFHTCIDSYLNDIHLAVNKSA